MGIWEEAIKLIKNKQVDQITENIFKVGKRQVAFHKFPGRTIVTCTCINHCKHCRQPVICKHKIAAIFVKVIRRIKEC